MEVVFKCESIILVIFGKCSFSVENVNLLVVVISKGLWVSLCSRLLFFVVSVWIVVILYRGMLKFSRMVIRFVFFFFVMWVVSVSVI